MILVVILDIVVPCLVLGLTYLFSLPLLQFSQQRLFLCRECLPLKHSIEIATASGRILDRVMYHHLFLFFFFNRSSRTVVIVVELVFNFEVVVKIRLLNLDLMLLVNSLAKIVFMSRKNFLPLCLILFRKSRFKIPT